jgi:hypothetical protein
MEPKTFEGGLIAFQLDSIADPATRSEAALLCEHIIENTVSMHANGRYADAPAPRSPRPQLRLVVSNPTPQRDARGVDAAVCAVVDDAGGVEPVTR